MLPWKTLSKKTVLAFNRFLTVESHAIELPDGAQIPDWPFVITPDAAIVVVRDRAGRFPVFRQTKYAIPGVTLATVGGMLEPGEDPLTAAKRELCEESGYAAASWTSLGSYCAEPNRGVCTIHLFLADEAEQVCQPNADDLEEQHLVLLSRAELEHALLSGQFKAIMWTAAVSMALHVLDARRSQ